MGETKIMTPNTREMLLSIVAFIALILTGLLFWFGVLTFGDEKTMAEIISKIVTNFVDMIIPSAFRIIISLFKGNLGEVLTATVITPFLGIFYIIVTIECAVRILVCFHHIKKGFFKKVEWGLVRTKLNKHFVHSFSEFLMYILIGFGFLGMYSDMEPFGVGLSQYGIYLIIISVLYWQIKNVLYNLTSESVRYTLLYIVYDLLKAVTIFISIKLLLNEKLYFKMLEYESKCLATILGSIGMSEAANGEAGAYTFKFLFDVWLFPMLKFVFASIALKTMVKCVEQNMENEDLVYDEGRKRIRNAMIVMIVGLVLDLAANLLLISVPVAGIAIWYEKGGSYIVKALISLVVACCVTLLRKVLVYVMFFDRKKVIEGFEAERKAQSEETKKKMAELAAAKDSKISVVPVEKDEKD